MRSLQSIGLKDCLDVILLTELKALGTGEKRLLYLLPRLHDKPQLRESFLQQLAEVQQRTDRLDAVLNPLDTFDDSALPVAGPDYEPAA